jgi:hypothetical protein
MKKLIIVFTIFATQLIACTLCSTKKVTCSAFDNSSFQAWFPYNTNSYQIFKNTQTQDTVGFQFTAIDYSQAYEIQTGGYGNRVGACNKSASVYATAGDRYINVQYFIDSVFNQPNANQQLNIAINNSQFYAEEINSQEIKTSISNNTSVAVNNTAVLLNNIFCEKLCTITSDTLNSKLDRIYKVFISKGKGIIGYEHYPSLHQWFIQ